MNKYLKAFLIALIPYALFEIFIYVLTKGDGFIFISLIITAVYWVLLTAALLFIWSMGRRK